MAYLTKHQWLEIVEDSGNNYLTVWDLNLGEGGELRLACVWCSAALEDAVVKTLEQEALTNDYDTAGDLIDMQDIAIGAKNWSHDEDFWPLMGTRLAHGPLFF